MSGINDRDEPNSSGIVDISLNNDTLDAELTLLESTLTDLKENECNNGKEIIKYDTSPCECTDNVENIFSSKPDLYKGISNKVPDINAQNTLLIYSKQDLESNLLELREEEKNSSEPSLQFEIVSIIPTNQQVKSTDTFSAKEISSENSPCWGEIHSTDVGLDSRADDSKNSSNNISDVKVISHVTPTLFCKHKAMLNPQSKLTSTQTKFRSTTISDSISNKNTFLNCSAIGSNEDKSEYNCDVEEDIVLGLKFKHSLSSGSSMIEMKTIDETSKSVTDDSENFCSENHCLPNSNNISQELNPCPSSSPILPNKDIIMVPVCIGKSDTLPESGLNPCQSTEYPQSEVLEHCSRTMPEDLDTVKPISKSVGLVSDHEVTLLKLEKTDIILENGESQSAGGLSIGCHEKYFYKKETPVKEESIPKIDSVIEKPNRPIYCSTPVGCVLNESRAEQTSSIKSTVVGDFGLSPLNTASTSSETDKVGDKIGVKRKILGLERIEEIDEDLSDSCLEKKMRLTDSKVDCEIMASNDANVSSVSCFEAPAKSILKKWQPSGLSKNSSTSYLVLDECGESECEESAKPSQEPVDDFESEFNFLTEELLKGSHNIEVLEKYHSQLQLESQMDDEKFDELMQELRDLDEKTFLSIKPNEESFISLKPDNDALLTVKSEAESIDSEAEISKKEPYIGLQNNSLGELKTTECNKSYNESSVINKTKDNQEFLLNSDKRLQSLCKVKHETVEASGSKDLSNTVGGSLESAMDEEDFLLAENDNTEKKPYVFFEFVSNDPKENEDNYNPEWQKLGKLTSDEERYKAVRDRWRSLVPPDPNRDLTCRQWRKKNNEPPLIINTLNNNHRMEDDNEKNQLCTAVFEKKISKIVEELEAGRRSIIKQRNIDFENLAIDQDNEQRRLKMRCCSDYDLAMLHRHHIEQCRLLKDQHDAELTRIRSLTEQKVRVLREASDEVLLFQKFYKGVGTNDNEVCMYMSDIQVQELMETEEMLEQYTRFYE